MLSSPATRVTHLSRLPRTLAIIRPRSLLWHAHHNRETGENGSVTLEVVLGKATLENAAQSRQTDPFPPAVDAHDAMAADFDSESAAIVAVGILVDGCVVAGTAAWVLHGG